VSPFCLRSGCISNINLTETHRKEDHLLFTLHWASWRWSPLHASLIPIFDLSFLRSVHLECLGMLLQDLLQSHHDDVLRINLRRHVWEDRFGWLTERIFPSGVTNKYIDTWTCRKTQTRPCVEPSSRRSSDRYAWPVRLVCTASTAWTSEFPLERDPVEEEAPWVDLASAGQLDLPPSATRTRGDKKLGFGREN
jgi:hypothetical protein